MGWTTPATFTPGQIVTDVALNVMQDNLSDLHRRATTVPHTFDTSQTTTSLTYTNLAGVGPEVTVTVGSSGLLVVAISARLSNNTTNTASFMAFEISGATAVAAGDATAIAHQSATAGDWIQLGRTVTVSGLNAGLHTVTAKYRVASASTGTFVNRHMTVFPLGP